MYEWKTKDVHGRGPSNLHLGLFVCYFDVYRDSQPVPSINYGDNKVTRCTKYASYLKWPTCRTWVQWSDFHFTASLSDWCKNLAPLSQPIRSKTKTTRDALARIFPRFCFEFWLVHRIVWVATKLFGTSHRIGWENDIQTIVTRDPSPRTTELLTRSNEISGSEELRDNRTVCLGFTALNWKPLYYPTWQDVSVD